MPNFNVSNFLGYLQQEKPAVRSNDQNEKKIEKIYLSFPDNYGRYQIFPACNVVTGFPFTSLKNTREIKMNRRTFAKEGQDSHEYSAWMKILPKSAYVMIDQSGRLVSSLTAEDERLLDQAQNLFDALYDRLGGNNREIANDPSKNRTIGFLRRRNYTLFEGKCLNFWKQGNPNSPARSNFPALFVTSASGFLQEVDNNLADGRITHGGSDEWINQVYNRDLTRSGYLLFSISLGAPGSGKIGYQISITHESDRGQYLKDFSITQEEMDAMSDPVEDFLGWQASKEEPGRLFNKRLMVEIISYLSQQLSAIDLAINTGADINEAISRTNAQFLQQNPQQMQTNVDPMLQQGNNNPAMETQQVFERVVSQNTDPFKNPATSINDPFTQMPQQTSAPYTPPAFASGFGN